MPRQDLTAICRVRIGARSRRRHVKLDLSIELLMFLKLNKSTSRLPTPAITLPS